MMAPVSMNQMGTARAPVMLMPVQTMQQMPGTSGNSNGLMFVQVPYGSTQENTSSQPQGTINPSGPQLSEDLQVHVRFIFIKVSGLKVNFLIHLQSFARKNFSTSKLVRPLANSFQMFERSA